MARKSRMEIARTQEETKKILASFKKENTRKEMDRTRSHPNQHDKPVTARLKKIATRRSKRQIPKNTRNTIG
ncbi:hypothetical protein Trydic_g23750 [Trypoxylus dichotomus]